MRDKRNCNMGYPMPMMVPPFGYPVNMGGNNQNINNQINNLEQQINLLDQRVSRLENLNATTTTTNYNKYNDSNYYMV